MTKILNSIAQAIYDKKGFNILVLDIRGISSMTDYIVIAEGNVNRHVNALSHTIKAALIEEKIRPFHSEGEKDGDWVVLDFGDVIVHLFIPEMREKYNLEELWKKSKIIDVKINLGNVSK